MAADSVGRKLGIGLRIAAKAIQQRADSAAASRPPHPTRPSSPVAADAFRFSPKGRPSVARGVLSGAKHFGKAVWGPMAHTGSVLWLEVTGLFFALFAAFFGQNVWKFRHDYAGGPERTHFYVYAALTLVFAWFTSTSFLKAKQKEKTHRARLSSR